MRPSKAPVARKPLIVASSNPGKLREFGALLSDLPFELHSLGDVGAASPEESGASFLENALLKARHAAAAASAAGFRGAPAAGVAAIADDSGLEVDALGGAPGIFSARYAGAGADDAANNAKLLSALAGTPLELRRARSHERRLLAGRCPHDEGMNGVVHPRDEARDRETVGLRLLLVRRRGSEIAAHRQRAEEEPDRP